jgi:hypothetical protein
LQDLLKGTKEKLVAISQEIGDFTDEQKQLFTDISYKLTLTEDLVPQTSPDSYQFNVDKNFDSLVWSINVLT